jgi:thiol-disulfide isomerase/thioredoxin/outer membrane lipoprotein-sorting protein
VVTAERTDELSVSLTVAAQKPNRLRARVQVRGESILAVSDGETYWVFFPPANKFLRQPAPDDIQGLTSREPLSQIISGSIKGLTLGLLEPDPFGKLIGGLTEAEYVGTEEVAEQEAHHLRLRTANVETHLWLASEGGRVLRAELTPWRSLKRLAEQKPGLQEVTIALDYGAAPEEFHGEGRFSFQPPADATQVEDVGQLMSREMTEEAMIDFTLPGLQKDTWHLADLKGNVIGLDFWATWCGPCRAEMPKLQQIYEELKGQGFVLLAVNVGEAEQKVKSFLQEQGLEVPVALDQERQTASAYGIEALPTLFLIGRGGRIRHVQKGYAPGMEEDIKRRIQALLDEEPGSPAE